LLLYIDLDGRSDVCPIGGWPVLQQLVPPAAASAAAICET